MNIKLYSSTIKQLKNAILLSRYKAATLANKELLTLYFNVGQLLSQKLENASWGDKILQQMSADLQSELPGLKGFSATNIKRIKTFYSAWCSHFLIGPSVTDQLDQNTKKSKPIQILSISPSVTDQLPQKNQNPLIGPSLTDQLAIAFFSTSFTHHIEIITKAKSMEEKFFYIHKVANEYWSVNTLKHHLNTKLFKKQGKLQNNFTKTIATESQREKALQTFKDEYLLDFINIEDPDIEDEKIIENEIVRNIKKFIMHIGNDFAFIGNQYRLLVDEDEYFIDLLFFNRKLNCLVAFELKNGKFKPAYAGQLNFYLSALDEQVKQPHENFSIGIILCKEKNNKVVEYSFRDISKPMGVATYKTSAELPKQFKNALPSAAALKKLMGK